MLKEILGTDKKHNKIVPALFAYLFNRIDLKRFISYVEEDLSLPREYANSIKDKARVSGYVLKNCKLYTYATYYARLRGEARPRPSDYGVELEDAKILQRLNLNHLNLSCRAFTLKEFDTICERLMNDRELKNYIGKFVTKKMTFLIQSYGEHRYDIETNLKEMALIAVYKKYPQFQTYLHMMNIAKAQIHNKGHTFITSQTAKSRQRLIQNEHGGHEAVHVELSVVADVAAPVQYGTEIRERLTALEKIEHKLTDRSRDFLLAAAGQYNEGLSTFMAVNNEEAAETLPYEKYLNHLYAYFETTPQRIENLYSKIRKAIS